MFLLIQTYLLFARLNSVFILIYLFIKFMKNKLYKNANNYKKASLKVLCGLKVCQKSNDL